MTREPFSHLCDLGLLRFDHLGGERAHFRIGSVLQHDPRHGDGALVVTTVPLEAGDDYRQFGALPQPLFPGARLAATMTLGNGENLQARFSED